MYVNPFVFGVVVGFISAVVLIVVAALIFGGKKKGE